MKKNYRQGDVYLFSVDSIPTGRVKEDKVVAYGEVTGHKHQVIDGDVFVDSEGGMYLSATVETKMKHMDASGKVADHNTVNVDPGNYRIVIQEEYQPEGWKRVVD